MDQQFYWSLKYDHKMLFLSFICYRAKVELRTKEMKKNNIDIEEKMQHMINQVEESVIKLKELRQKRGTTQVSMRISQEGSVSV